MDTYQGSDGRAYTLGRVIGSGGEGTVCEVEGRPTEVGKLWKKPDPLKSGEVKAYKLKAEKLQVLLEGQPAVHEVIKSVVGVAWPKEILADDAGATVGFVMPRTPRNSCYRELVNYCVPEARQRIRKSGGSGFSRTDLLTIAQNVALLFDHLHRYGYVVGDVNHTNILANNKGRVYLIDVDSIQVQDPKSGRVYRCEVGKDDFTPPRLTALRFAEVDRTVDDDLFGLAALIFHLLMEGSHPYDTLERTDTARKAREGNIRLENIRKSRSPFALLDVDQTRNWLDLVSIPDANLRKREESRFLKRVKGKATVAYERLLPDRATRWLELEPELRGLFVQAFGNGQGARPEALQWARALSAAGARKPDAAPATRVSSQFPVTHSQAVKAPIKGAARTAPRPASISGKRKRASAGSPALPTPVTGGQQTRVGTTVGATGGGRPNYAPVPSGGNANGPIQTVKPGISQPSISTIFAPLFSKDELTRRIAWVILLMSLVFAWVGFASMCGAVLADEDGAQRVRSGRNVGPCEKMQVGAVLGQCDFSGRGLRGRDLTGGELQHSDLRFAILEGSVLDYANLSDTDLTGAKLGGVSMRGTSLAGAKVEEIDLSGVKLYSTDISDIESFDNANLRNTVFPQETDLSGVSFRGADLSES